MATPLHEKSTTDEIRARFDGDVERFSNLESGQAATIDAPLVLELLAAAAVASTSPIRHLLDLGCGAGNNTLKLLELAGTTPAVDLLDLSGPMLERAQARIQAGYACPIRLIQGDFREAELATDQYDVVLAAAVLHHLRDDADWESAFGQLFRIIRPGGSVWISDLVAHESQAVHTLMWHRYGEYLVGMRGDQYRDQVFDYVDREDSPRPVTYQIELLRRVGFRQVELLHKNSCFAAFGAIK